MAATALGTSHWIIAVPNEAGSAKAAAERFKSAMIEVAGKPLADMTPFHVPSLRVGSLDSLMALSDDLARTDAFVEGVLKKVERQVAESYNALKLVELQKSAPAGGDAPTMASVPPLGLRCSGQPVHQYVAAFKWDAESWDTREPLPELVKRLQGAAEKVDADMRVVAAGYQEKKTALQAAERKRSGNLMVAPLEDVVTPKSLQAAGAEWIPADSEFLSSVVVVLPKTAEEGFLESYAALDAAAVPMGPDGRREAVKGSPVVPQSARKIAEDKDGYVLYTLVILKRFADSFRAACREKRYTVREFAYVPGLAGSGAKAATELAGETDKALLVLKDQSRRRYEEIMSLWLHVKAVRVFAEAVLRYGVPVNFTAILFRLHKGEGKRMLQAAQSAWKFIAGGSAIFDSMYAPPPAKPVNEDDDQAVGPDPVIPGITDAAAGPSLPFVFLELDVRVDTAAAGHK